MRDWTKSTGPVGARELLAPEFLKHVRREYPGGRVRPDDEDFPRSQLAFSYKEAGEQYRAAQTLKLTRVYRKWKASQN
jgi:hypothetical protein